MDFVPDRWEETFLCLQGRRFRFVFLPHGVLLECLHLFNYIKKVLRESMTRNKNPENGGKI